MDFQETEISGVWLIKPRRFSDARGYFSETFREDLFEAATGIKPNFIQENESESVQGVVRGLHYQSGAASQAKLVRVALGTIVDVAVDLRPGSPTFGRYISAELSHENGLQLYIPRGFAHGFAVVSPLARFLYKVDNYYCPQAEHSIRFDDPEIGVVWPFAAEEMILSPKDLNGKYLKDSDPAL